MTRFIFAAPKRAVYLTMLLGSALLVDKAISQVTYDIRAKTKDIVNATIYFPATATLAPGRAKQGSFGAPSINDKGSVAYACILTGSGITALTNNSVVVRAKGKRRANAAVQSGVILSNTFIADPLGGPGTARMYRIGRDVAINNRNQVVFAGELLHLHVPPVATPFTVNASTYGAAVPFNAKNPRQFANFGLVTYTAFSEDILKKTLSINIPGAVAFNADVMLTSTKSAAGFGYALPGYQAIVATVESPVIGLPYFTKFQSFTDAIIANGNVCFVVAALSEEGNDFDGIWQGNNPNLQPVIIKNSKSPSGGTFTSFDGKIGPSRNGKILAFLANVSTGTSGVFRANKSGSGVISIVSNGAVAPTNTATGTLGAFTGFTLAASNNAGQVAVLGSVGGKDGIWLSDKNGKNLALIVIEGASITVRGKVKQVTKIAFNPVSGLNAKGQVAFTASFNDRTSAVIVAK